MSATRSGPGDHAREISPEVRSIRGMVRRFVVRTTRAVLWQLVGHTLLDKDTETRDAEPFTGIGFYSRPPSGGNPEAIVVFAGGDGNPLIAALRDERTRAALFKIAGALVEDETAIYNSVGLIRIKADGTIEARSPGGTAVPLVTRAEFLTHGHPIIATGATTPCAGPVTGALPAGSAATFPGTSKFKAE